MPGVRKTERFSAERLRALATKLRYCAADLERTAAAMIEEQISFIAVSGAGAEDRAVKELGAILSAMARARLTHLGEASAAVDAESPAVEPIVGISVPNPSPLVPNTKDLRPKKAPGTGRRNRAKDDASLRLTPPAPR